MSIGVPMICYHVHISSLREQLGRQSPIPEWSARGNEVILLSRGVAITDSAKYSTSLGVRKTHHHRYGCNCYRCWFSSSFCRADGIASLAT